MKKSVLFIMLCSYISGYESTATSPTLITFKLESSEILTDSQGQNSVEPNFGRKVFVRICFRPSTLSVANKFGQKFVWPQNFSTEKVAVRIAEGGSNGGGGSVEGRRETPQGRPKK